MREAFYPYQYMDYWEKFNTTSLPEKEGFYSNENTEHIVDVNFRHTKRVLKDFGIKNLGEDHDLYLQK